MTSNDIMAQVNQLVESIKGNAELKESFRKDPVKTIEGLLGVDLPDDIVEKVVAGVKGKMSADNGKDVLGMLKKFS